MSAPRRAPLGADLRILCAGILGFLLQCLASLQTAIRNRGTKRP